MAHFQRPPDGDFAEYDADNQQAVGSLWRMSIPVGGRGGEVALWGGQGLTVRSNNENAVANPLPERSSGDLRIFRLVGRQLNDTTMLEFGVGRLTDGRWQWSPGSPWPGSLQVRVTATTQINAAADALVTLDKPHMALNADGISYLYDMQYNHSIGAGLSAAQIVTKITAAGRLKHLVINCHGYIDYKSNAITNSRIALGAGFSDVALFSRLTSVSGGVVWLAGCVIGNDNVRNIQRATNGRCHVVAPMTSMQLKPGLITGKTLPFGKVDMFARFSPKVFTPGGGLIGFQSFLGMGKQLGFSA